MKYYKLILGFAGAAILLGGSVALANPSYFATPSSTATATSTLTYMTPGTATTTLYYDAYEDASNAKSDSAVLALQLTGSSTISVWNISYEYALNNGVYNCKSTPTACDWYSDTLFGTGMMVSTTTQAVNLNIRNSLTVNFASTTVGGKAGISTRTTRLINVPTPTRFTRVVITMPAGSLNGAVWASIQPSKETPE